MAEAQEDWQTVAQASAPPQAASGDDWAPAGVQPAAAPAGQRSQYQTLTQKLAPVAEAGAEAFKGAFEGSGEEFQQYQDYLAKNPLFGNAFIRQAATSAGALLSLTTRTIEGAMYGAGAMVGASYVQSGGSQAWADRLTRDVIMATQVSAPELREAPLRPDFVKTVAPAITEFQETVIKPGIEQTANDILAKPVEAPPEGQPAPHPLQALYDHLSQVDDAKQLGVIGEDKEVPTPAEQPSPAAQAQQDIPPRSMAAARSPDDKITMTPTGEPIDAYQARFKDWVAKIKAPSEVGDVISRAAQENDYFPEARAGEVPAAHVEKVAQAAGIDPATIDRAGLSTKFTRPAEIRAVEQSLLQASSDFRDAAAKMDADPSPENAAAMMEARVRRDYTLEYTLGLRSEWGRAGQALKDILDVSKREQAVTDLLREKGESVDDLRQIAAGMRNLTPEQSARVMSGMRGKQPPHWFFWAWQQGLISGIVTHTKYLAVNTGFTYMERVLSPALSALVGAARGGEKTFFGEPVIAHWGMLRAVPDAMRSSFQAFRSGLRVPLDSELKLAARGEESPQGAATPYQTAIRPEWGIWKRVFDQPALDKAETVLGVPGKSANAIHTFYKVLNQGAALKSAAYHAAAKEGLSPLEQGFWDRYNYHVANPSDAVLKQSVEDSYSGAFMAKMGAKTGQLAQAVRNNPVLKWFFPFMHIPFEIARSTVEYTPLAVLGPEMRGALLGEKGAPAQNLAIAKMTAGSALIGYMAMKYLNGEATGDYPHDPKERRDWQLQGKQPNSIRAGDQWVSMERFGPPGNVARLGANIGAIIAHYNGQDDDAVMKAVWSSGMAAMNLVADEVGFQSMRNMIDAMEDPKHAARYASWQLGSFMPFSSMITQQASIQDPYMRQANSFVSGLKYRIPYLRETLPVKRDMLYGEPIPNPGYHTVFRESPIRADPIKLEMQRLDYHPAAPVNRVGGLKLSPEMYDEYAATAGPLVKRMLEAYVGQPGYGQLPDSVKAKEFHAIVAAGRAQARIALQAHHPELIQQAVDAKKTAIFGKP